MGEREHSSLFELSLNGYFDTFVVNDALRSVECGDRLAFGTGMVQKWMEFLGCKAELSVARGCFLSSCV